MSATSFHSLRPPATYLVKDAGVSEAVTKDFVGHDSKAIVQNYTHIEDAAKQASVEK